MTILTLANSKGGGGKTTIAACLAAELTRRGKEGVLLDADPQRSLTVCVFNTATRTALVSHIRNELISAGISVIGCEIGQWTVYAEAELAGSAPCWMGKPAIKAADEISALATELLPYQGGKGKKK